MTEMDLPSSMTSLTVNDQSSHTGGLFQSFCAEINNLPTEFVSADFNNSYFLIVTQFKKIGSFIVVEKDDIYSPIGTQETSFDSKTLLGASELESQLAARFLAENLNIKKTFYLSASLKDYDVETLKAIKDICLDNIK